MTQHLNMQVHWKGGFPGKTIGLLLECVGASSPRKLCYFCHAYIEDLDCISFKMIDTDRHKHSMWNMALGLESWQDFQTTAFFGRFFALGDLDSFSKVKNSEYYPFNLFL